MRGKERKKERCATIFYFDFDIMKRERERERERERDREGGRNDKLNERDKI
jgi:hypothetical protein